MRTIHGILILAAVTLAACGKKKQDASQAAAADTAVGMGGMGKAMQGVQMMPMMRAHLDSLGVMEPAQIGAVMAAHQGLASRMMDAMRADMRAVNMKPDSAWSALSDSLRQDLAELPGLSGAGLKTRMQGHIGRMQRIMALHQGMMRM
jgi:hypothetical protein